MALAYLRYKGHKDGHHVFHADTGTAKYFKYVLGEKIIKLSVAAKNFLCVFICRA